eukprot:CAMPEP_0183708872 /NCGR_PEP_ID=MMETSP0737-20130205/5043_1 /TAXON_ID=385413 /ORGANISM="Thalassiosira miniscula, Strain CCMP1093" /LENGTH=582 /DNA_ID=CAMNT_0025936825 /DNA_START=191 /DNA_END=1939 /DNA_ORIENTATION=+
MIQPTCISFLTDVEGDGSYFDRFVRHSKVLDFRQITPYFGRYGKDGRIHGYDSACSGVKWNMGEWEEDFFPYDKEVIFLEDTNEDGESCNNSMLVYGGDIWDKGGSDLYVLRQLLSLHRRYPNRVHFLMGNRDINKMRIVDELGIGSIHDQNESLPNHGGVYWLRNAVCSGMTADPDSIVPRDSAAERLKWMLRKTMGSIDAFELRRKELERERVAIVNGTAVSTFNDGDQANGNATVTDDEVAQSYIRSCNPVSGIMSQYLTKAKLTIRFGSALFLHGALPFVRNTSNNMQSLELPTPWAHQTDGGKKAGYNSLTNWINASNDFASDKVKAWKRYHGYLLENSTSAPPCDVWAAEGGYFNNTPGGTLFGALMQYGMGTLPNRSKTQSCVYNSWMHDGLPREDMFGSDDSMRELSEFFKREGIEIILTGHQPVGDLPWPIEISPNGEGRKLWILPCDTSFSGDTCWTSLDGFDSIESESLGRGSLNGGRGEKTFSEPLIDQNADSVKIHGCLSDGTYYEMSNIMDANEEDLQIGRKLGQIKFNDNESGGTKEGIFWVKGMVGENKLVSYGKGFNVWNAYIKS